MIHPLAAHLVPSLRWDPGHGYAYLDELITEALEMGVGGFVLPNGPAEDVRALTQELHRRSRHPLLIATDAEAGAPFTGSTAIPPLLALAALRDADAVRRAARITARELRQHGVNWALAPVADLDRVAINPVLGSRTFGSDAQKAAEWVVEWIDACQAEGVLACAKHFPGFGRATVDPSLAASAVDAVATTLWNDDLIPFRGAIDTGVASVMLSSVAYPGLDKSGIAAARSRPIVSELLRDELHFEGLIVTDTLGAPGLRQNEDEGIAAIQALAAGADLLLAPSDLHGALESIERGLEGGLLLPDALEGSRNRREFWADWALPAVVREPTLEDVLWARQIADTLVHPVRGSIPNVGPVVDVIQIDDDAKPGWPVPGRGYFVETLRVLGFDARVVDRPTDEGRGAAVLALFGGPGEGKGRAGYSAETKRRVAQTLAEARQMQRTVVVLVFGPPKLVGEIPEAQHVVCCWAGERGMQEAAARRLV